MEGSREADCGEEVAICFNATSSLIAAGSSYAAAAFVMRRDHPRLKWAGVALMGITAMQWVEGMLWLDGPRAHGEFNHFTTVALIPLALLAQAWGPLWGSAFDLPIRGRGWLFCALLALGLVIVVSARVIYQPAYTQVTPEGHLNWWSTRNPPVYQAWSYGLWGLTIGAPFLIWWRPFWQGLLIVSWGWIWATISFLVTDSAASHWCFFVSFYALFVFVYGVMTPAKQCPSI